MGKLRTLLPAFEFAPLREGALLYWKGHAVRDGMARYP
jgi:hypothetical protein